MRNIMLAASQKDFGKENRQQSPGCGSVCKKPGAIV
jgi:hypothetical protein